ncbi:hypothetical protein QQZ08_007598 [Neonectria magnoliae]|uniref:Major facilitator superfamily (MFS) profile domain-containing protein n=1 Tax=Neonectria magnoliae TaxID=2732573 RepID=A0ABR1HYK7_9HYPO
MATLEAVNVSDAYPEHGLKAYSVVFGAWLALFPASGLLNSTGIFQAYLARNQLSEYSESEIGWIFSVFAFLFFFGGLQVAYYQFLLAFGGLGGVSSSILWTSSIATLGHWFHRKQGLATGLATTAGGFGGVVYPLAFNQLSKRLQFPWVLRCFALLSAGCLLLSLLFLKTRLPRNKHAKAMFDWRGFKDVRFTLTMSAIFILDWAVLVPPAYITTYAFFHGFSNVSPHILAITNAASIFGRCLPGPIADRVGRFNVMIVCSALCSVSILGLWLNSSRSVAAMTSFAVLYGLFSGSAYSLTPVCVAQLCRKEEYASKYGTAYGIVSLATLAGIPISGNILNTGSGNNYEALILFCGCAYLASTLLFVLARGVSQGWRLQTKF